MALVLVLGSLFAPAAFGADGRGYEQVSPVDKHGGDIMAYVPRTRVSADGNAVQFASLVGFGDVQGSGAAVEYLGQRTPTGWVTHAISPTEIGSSLTGLIEGADAYYDGSFSPDFARGIFVSPRPLTTNDNVRDVPNLYLRDDLRTPGRGNYQLLTPCPACDATNTPLDPLPSSQVQAQRFQNVLAGASSDLGHIAFESPYNLTSDAPAQPAFCGFSNEPFFFPPPSPWFCPSRLYEWDHGTLRLAGILPDGTPADMSFAGAKARNPSLTPHVVSDGSDGHSRIFFTQPTMSDNSGQTFDDLDPSDAFSQLFVASIVQSGNLFMRVDHTQTVQLNASERDPNNADTFAPTQYLDATRNGQRVFFKTSQALTNDAPVGGAQKIYMYDASKPDSAQDNLTFITVDSEPADGSSADAVGVIGTSRDGHYVYLISIGQLVGGRPADGRPHVYLWNDGVIRDIGSIPNFEMGELVSSGFNYQVPSTTGSAEQQAAVTSDGRHLVFTSYDGSGLGGYDHGACRGPDGCREVYVYSADSGELACASCNPTGARATADANLFAQEIHGGARITEHILDHPINDDGSKVFFSSGEKLVPEDVNGRSDAYEYDVATRTIKLLSTGTSGSDSWFVDASADGNDAFFVTRQRLVGWDRDDNYDLYDARVGGGFPEPPPARPACNDDSCQGAPGAAPAPGATASAGFTGHGNVRASLRRRARRCRRGHVRRHHRCVRRRAHRHHAGRRGA